MELGGLDPVGRIYSIWLCTGLRPGYQSDRSRCPLRLGLAGLGPKHGAAGQVG
jgi:hypothetical protein